MKTERRHELQTNQLADWMGHQFEHVKPHSKTILAAGILGAAVVIAAGVILKDRASASESAWTEFHVAFGARDPVALTEVAKRHAGTVVALWARQAQADLELNRGIAALYTNREDAMFALSDARKAYTDVINGAASYPELLQHSLFGLAEAHEASTNLDAARDYYQQVAQKFPDSAMGKEATVRLLEIKDPKVAKFYSWFSKQKPRPSSQFSLPNLQGMPDDLTKLPDKSDFLPPAPEGGPVAPATEVPVPTAPASTTPAPITPAPTTPAPTTPAPTTPAPTTPAPTTPAPASTTPAPTTPAPATPDPTKTTPEGEKKGADSAPKSDGATPAAEPAKTPEEKTSPADPQSTPKSN